LAHKQIVGDAEPEAIARQAAGRGAELDRAGRIARGACPVAAQKLQAQRPTRIASGALSEVKAILIAPQWQEPG